MSLQFVLFTLFRATYEGRISEGRGGRGEEKARQEGGRLGWTGKEGRESAGWLGEKAETVKDRVDG